MESNLSQELLRHVADRPEDGADYQILERATQVKRRRFQAWHYLILVCTAFWMLFAVILIASGFFFLVAALAVLALLSGLVIGLAWAFQNNV